MTKWYTHDVCELTGLSARMLRHYEKIVLLKPSMRLPNGYRVFSEADLAKLQQILALRSFGLELSKVKEVLSGKCDALQLLQMQKDFLEQKAQQFKEAIDILAAVIDDSKIAGSVDITLILKLIGVYKMTKELEQSWAAKVFTKEQLKKFAALPQFTEEESKQYTKDWEALIAETAKHIKEDPHGEIGKIYAQKWYDLAYSFWKDDELAGAVWDARKNNKIDADDVGAERMAHIPKDVMAWMDKAIEGK